MTRSINLRTSEIPDEVVDEDKVDLKVEDWYEKKEEEENLGLSDKEFNATNDDKEEDRPKNTKEVMHKYLSFVKVFLYSDDLPLNVNRETLQESKIIKVISKKLLRNSIEMLLKLVEKEKSKEDGNDGNPSSSLVIYCCLVVRGGVTLLVDGKN